MHHQAHSTCLASSLPKGELKKHLDPPRHLLWGLGCAVALAGACLSSVVWGFERLMTETRALRPHAETGSRQCSWGGLLLTEQHHGVLSADPAGSTRGHGAGADQNQLPPTNPMTLSTPHAARLRRGSESVLHAGPGFLGCSSQSPPPQRL